MEASPNPTQPSSPKARLIVAVALTLALIGGVVALIVVLAGGDAERTFAKAPAACVKSWNEDKYAPTIVGKHQYRVHGYSNVQVLYLNRAGSAAVPATDKGATCTIVFAKASLDTERAAAAVILRNFGWGPLSELQPVSRLAELQTTAETKYNGKLQDDGTIKAL